MADNTTPQPGPAGNDAAPLLPDDSKQWADLAKELEDDKGVFEQEADDKPPEKTPPREPPADDDKTPEPDRPKPSYEQLEAAERGKTAALKAEREARHRAEENLQNVNKLIEDLRASRQRAQPQPQPQPEVKLPDVNEDPVGHFQARVQQLEQLLVQAHQGNQQTQNHIRAQHEEQVFWGHVRNAEAEFRKTSPAVTVNGQETTDYDAACDYLKQHRMQELTHIYPDDSALARQEAQQYGLPSPAHLRAAMLQQDAIAIASRAFQLGVSPAALYYEAAKTRGYKAPPPRGANGNGKIEAAKRGQKASLTISGGEGRKSNNDLTISDLSDLWLEDPDEFDKQWDKMKAAGKL